MALVTDDIIMKWKVGMPNNPGDYLIKILGKWPIHYVEVRYGLQQLIQDPNHLYSEDIQIRLMNIECHFGPIPPLPQTNTYLELKMTDEEYRQLAEETALLNSENARRYSKLLDQMEQVWPNLQVLIGELMEDLAKRKEDQ